MKVTGAQKLGASITPNFYDYFPQKLLLCNNLRRFQRNLGTRAKKRKMKRKAAATADKRKRQRKSTPRSRALAQLYNTIDLKVNTLSIGLTGITSAGPYSVSMYPPARGTAPINQFVGNRINLINLTMRWAFSFGDTTNICRVSIFQILGNLAGAGTTNFYVTPTLPLSPINSNPVVPFNTLYDKVFGLYQQDSVGPVGNIRVGKAFIPGSRLEPMIFPTVLGTPTSGEIVICALSDSVIAPNPGFIFYAQIKFTDA